MDDVFGFAHHLRLGDPERGLRDGNGEVVDFDAVELPDGDLNRAELGVVKFDLLRERAQDVVFQAAERNVGFGEKIAGAARGIEKRERGDFFLKRAEFFLAGTLDGNGADFGELGFERVEKKRVDDFVDIFNRRVMHAAGAARFGIERAFKNGAENRRGNFAPVKIVAGAGEENGFYGFVELGDFDVGVGEEPAVDVRERGERGVEIRVAVFRARVERLEKVDECAAQVARLEAGEIIVELIFRAENAGVFRVEAENEADAKHVEAFERALGGGIAVAAENFVVKQPDEFAGFDGKLHFALEVRGVPVVGEKGKAVVFFREIFEEDDFGRVVRAFHVVDAKFAEIADDDPARFFGKFEFVGVAFRLLERREERAVGLFGGLGEVDIFAFLLDEHARCGNGGVDERGVPEADAVFKSDKLRGIAHAVNEVEKLHPESLGFAFFVAAIFPFGGEIGGGGALFGVSHAGNFQ